MSKFTKIFSSIFNPNTFKRGEIVSDNRSVNIKGSSTVGVIMTGNGGKHSNRSVKVAGSSVGVISTGNGNVINGNDYDANSKGVARKGYRHTVVQLQGYPTRAYYYPNQSIFGLKIDNDKVWITINDKLHEDITNNPDWYVDLP